jgi:hypothetical protein
MGVVAALVDPGFRGMLLRGGFDGDQAAAVATRLALAWLRG